MTQRWNPRYLAYCAAHGRAPEAMLEHDRARWPGGAMTGFVLWIQAAWHRWACAAGHPLARDAGAILCAEDHSAFDAWLPTQTETAA